MLESEGKTTLSDLQLEAILDRAAKRGAAEALKAIGLDDQHAGKDITELRDLLTAWRETKRAAWSQVVQAFVTFMLAAMVAGMALLAWNYGGPKQ